MDDINGGKNQNVEESSINDKNEGIWRVSRVSHFFFTSISCVTKILI